MYVEPPRGEHGRVDLPPPVVGSPMSARELFDYRLFLLGVRDPAVKARLWDEGLAGQTAGGEPR